MMNNDLDAALTRLTLTPAHPALATLEDAVFARVDAGRGVELAPFRVGLMAAVGAVVIGLGSTALAPAPAQAASLLDSGVGLAPSTLLSGLLQ